jgi:hypothetical protein
MKKLFSNLILLSGLLLQSFGKVIPIVDFYKTVLDETSG